MATQVTTPYFRVSFPQVFKPRRNDLNGKDEFSVQALFPKDADLSKLHAAAHEACVKKFGEDKNKWPKNLRTPFRDQGERMKDGVLMDGYAEGAVMLNFKSSTKPGIVDEHAQEILDPSKFYAGCWARASVNAYAYNQKGNSGISFGLNHLQFVKHGEPFSGRPQVESAFAPIEGAESGKKDASQLW